MAKTKVVVVGAGIAGLTSAAILSKQGLSVTLIESHTQSGGCAGTFQRKKYGGRYLDEFERRDGEWRISKRTYILDWSKKFSNALEEMTPNDFSLNILNISEAGHPMYRPL